MHDAQKRSPVDRRRFLGGAVASGMAAWARTGRAQDAVPTPVPIRVQAPDLAFVGALQRQLRAFETSHASDGLVLSIVPAEPASDSLLNDLRLNGRRFAGAFVPSWLIPDLVRDGYIASVSPPPQPLPSAIARVRSFGGEWVASDFDHDCSLLYARQDLIEDHGATVPDTWEELIELLYATGLRVALPRTHAEQVLDHFAAMAACYVGDDPFWFQPDTLEPALTSDAHVQALSDWQRLSRHAVESASTGDLRTSFIDGSAAFLIASADAFPYFLASDVHPEVIGVSHLPGKRAINETVVRFGNVSGANWGGVTVANIAGNEQAGELFSFLAKPETQVAMAADLESGIVPVLTDTDRLSEAFQQMEWSRDATSAWFAALSATFENPHQLIPLRIAETRRYLLAFQAHLETFLANHVSSPDRTLSSIAADWRGFNDAIGLETQRELFARSLMPAPDQ